MLLFSHNIFLALGLLALASSVHANDSSARIGIGGLELVKNEHVAMVSEDLYVSPQQVRIEYVFRNTSAQDVQTEIAFPLPTINLAEYSNSPIGIQGSQALNFVDFVVQQDEKQLPVQVQVRAHDQKGQEISAWLEQNQIPLSPINQDYDQWYKQINALPRALQDELERRELMYFDRDNDNAYPLWNIQVTLHWPQRFPAGQEVRLKQSYRPVTGQEFFNTEMLKTEPSWQTNFCIDKGTEQGLRKQLSQQGADNPYLLAYSVEYILTTARNWQGSIGDFRLTVDKLKPDSIISLCLDGLKKTSPTTFEWRAQNYRPQQELRFVVFSRQPLLDN